MAVKWAVANGNWSAGATWNDGVVPTSVDVVYCNGHSIIMNVNNIVAKQIRNDVNPNTNIGGGYVQYNTGYTITADFYAVGTYIFFTNSNNTLTCIINGNIEVINTSFTTVNANAPGRHYVINGNVTGINTGSPLFFFNDGGRVISPTINGNFNAPNMKVMMGNTSATYATLAVNGNCDAYSLLEVKTSYVNCAIGGSLYLHSSDPAYIVCNTILYDENGFPVCLSNITPTNPTTFECRYVGITPNPLPYVIINPNTIAQTYPTEDKVLAPTRYGAQMELVGSYTPDFPPESVVLKDYEYGDSDDRKTGTMVQEVNVEVGCVTPEDVRKDVPLVGMGIVGSLVVPSVDDVREGVVFDNGSVGTLIVEGGGDRLRIADFGYYTNAQSDTYIVDLTEQDKPKFAVAEERVLIEMFPDLDLENIPDKYFDDLFVKYLKYRLIVEYYRTAGINSTFTPSEPTTEIVNYQNVRNEVWLNSANIYLKAWAKKYPESITKPQRILL